MVADPYLLQLLLNSFLIQNLLQRNFMVPSIQHQTSTTQQQNVPPQKELNETDAKINQISPTFPIEEPSKQVRKLLSELEPQKNVSPIPSPYNSIQQLELDIIDYSDFISENPKALALLKKALHTKGIVGIRSVPGYREKVSQFIETAREFALLPDSVKQKYSPDRDKNEFAGYEVAKEKFQREDGSWVIDDGKVSYYAYVKPADSPENRWPKECGLKESFLNIGNLMFETAISVLKKIDLVKLNSGAVLENSNGVGRMLHYKSNTSDNPLWCGAHFDHGIFTALLPAFYFENGEPIPEPKEAGLFVKTTVEGEFKKVVSDDPEVMLFQVGEFGQLISNDGINATKHEVHKAENNVERFTMAVFVSPSFDTSIKSTSVLTKDSRYGTNQDGTCKFLDWHLASLARYEVKK